MWYLAPDFKTYIFGILLQFVKIWHQQKRLVFFSITDPFRTHVPHFLLEQVVVNYTLVEEDILAGKNQGQGKLYPNVKVDPMIW